MAADERDHGLRAMMRTGILAAFFFLGAALSLRAEDVIRITAKRFEFAPSEITLKSGVPVILELTSEDRIHGFNLAAFKVRTDVKPGEVARIRVVPDKKGHFAFRCDVSCGKGHKNMSGELVVE
jgi:cytochrome c oxidase subunit 2